MATQEERRAAATGAILEATRQLIAKHRSVSVGMSEIARVAGVSKSNIHYHFDSRTGLFVELAGLMLRELESRVPADPADAGELARSVLEAQLEPDAVVLHLVGDALTIAGAPLIHTQLLATAEQLGRLGCTGDPLVAAAALTLFARQVAFGYFGPDEIDRFVKSLVSEPQVPRERTAQRSGDPQLTHRTGSDFLSNGQ